MLLLSFGCLVTVDVLQLFLTVPWVGLQFAIVVFPDHTYFLLYFILRVLISYTNYFVFEHISILDLGVRFSRIVSEFRIFRLTFHKKSKAMHSELDRLKRP